MRRHRVAAEEQPKQIGTIGDVNFPEYDGGAVYCRVPELGAQTDIYGGDCFIEYVEIPPDDLEFEDPKARWTVYRVDLDPEVPSWIDLDALAKYSDQDPEELEAAFVSNDPLERAYAYETAASYHGWREFDQYPLSLTCAETEKRYGADLGCYSTIKTALEKTIERMVDESAATGWSHVSDQLASDLEDEGFNPKSIVVEALFGDAIAVNEDVLVGPHWAEVLGYKHNDLWSEVGTEKLDEWLDKNGYDYLDKAGGRVPVAEGYASAEHVIRAVAEELDKPEEQVEEAAKSIDGWQEEISGSSSGRTYVWAKRKEGTKTEEARRRSTRTRRR
jgi:hypothetical protein